MEDKPKKYTEWMCAKGHSYSSPIPVYSVRCGRCFLSDRYEGGNVMMKPVITGGKV